MEWVGLIILGAILLCGFLYFLFSKKPVDPRAQDYAEHARTDTISSSWAGSYADEFYANNTLRSVEARKKVATSLAELHKKEGEARVAQSENDFQVARHQLAHELTVFQQKNTAAVLEGATGLKVTPVVYDQIKLEEHQTSESIRLKEAESGIEIKRTKALNEHEVEMDFLKKMNTLAAITRYRLHQFDAFDEVRGRLVTLLEEAHKIENSKGDMYLRAEIMGRMQQAIATYQEAFDVYRRQIVEGSTREIVGELDSITELTGGGGFGDAATPFRLQIEEFGEGE